MSRAIERIREALRRKAAPASDLLLEAAAALESGVRFGLAHGMADADCAPLCELTRRLRSVALGEAMTTNAASEVRYVPQRESWDCGVASLAMAAGVSYETALGVVPESQRGDQLNSIHVTQWLGQLGCAVRKTYAEHDDLRGVRLLAHPGHFVVVRPDNRVNDPARGEGLPLAQYTNPFDVWEVHRLAALGGGL